MFARQVVHLEVGLAAHARLVVAGGRLVGAYAAAAAARHLVVERAERVVVVLVEGQHGVGDGVVAIALVDVKSRHGRDGRRGRLRLRWRLVI